MGPSRVRTPSTRHSPWPTLRDWLLDVAPAGADIDALLAAGAYVDDAGIPLTPETAYRPGTTIWFHRPPPDEPETGVEIPVLHRDERLVVVDKPHFVATMPRGAHVRNTVVTRLREELGLPHLSPAHRLDRLTAGVLVLTTQPRWRALYQQLFAQRAVRKEYEAIAGHDPGLVLPTVVRSHIVKAVGRLAAYEVPGAEPNAETRVELAEHIGDCRARYRLEPRTGRTHQLRVHLASLGIPIEGDPLYPVVRAGADDGGEPLQLLARRLEFTDPVDGQARRFTSARELGV